MIKEVVKGKRNRYIIRTGTYAHRLKTFLELFAEAQTDFPGLTAADVEVFQYGGQRYKRTWGIEFNLPGEPPDGYTEIEQMELTL